MLKKFIAIKLDHWLVLLLGIAFILRIPSLFEPYWYGDEGIYLTIGQALSRGLNLYRDIYDNKPPLIYLMAALAQNQTWFRLILLFWNMINVYLLYRLAKLILKKELAVFLAGLFFIFLSLIPEGNIANGEIFMIMPTTAAMLLLYKKSQPETGRPLAEKVKSYFIVGVLFSIAFLFKAPAGFSFAAAIIFLIFFSEPKKIFNLKTEYLILGGGFILLPLLMIIYFWGQGILPLYLRAAFFQNLGYLSSWEKGWNQSLFSLSSGFTQRGLLLAIIFVNLFIFRKYFSKTFLLLILWFFFDLFAALLAGRPYPHYLIQVAPALSLLLVFPLVKSKMNLPRPKGCGIFFPRSICSEIMEKIFVFVALSLLAAAFFYYRFWHYPVWDYYGNFYQFATGKKARQAYFDFFDKRVSETYKIASYIKTLTQPTDRIFVWGDEAYLYVLSERLPAGRYTVAYHVLDFNGWQETLTAIEKNQPKLIIKVKNSPAFYQLDKILANDYLKIAELERSIIFQKI